MIASGIFEGPKQDHRRQRELPGKIEGEVVREKNPDARE